MTDTWLSHTSPEAYNGKIPEVVQFDFKSFLSSKHQKGFCFSFV